MDRIAVLVLAYGGPGSLDDVKPYLDDVRGGRPTSRDVLDEVVARYRRIGGRSPILEQTTAQAAAIETALERLAPRRYRCFVGMRHWHPYIAEALDSVRSAGIGRAVAVAMAPHESRLSIGAYADAVEHARGDVDVRMIRSWSELPGLLDALAGRVRDAMARFPAAERDRVSVLFTAHSLPERIRGWDDPYEEELRRTVRGVLARLGDVPHVFAYQSAALTTGEPWLGPDAAAVLAEWAAAGRTRVVVAPVGFLTEHVEILYDLDIELQQIAVDAGVRLERIEMAGTAAAMIDGLAGRIRAESRAAGWETADV